LSWPEASVMQPETISKRPLHTCEISAARHACTGPCRSTRGRSRAKIVICGGAIRGNSHARALPLPRSLAAHPLGVEIDNTETLAIFPSRHQTTPRELPYNREMTPRSNLRQEWIATEGITVCAAPAASLQPCSLLAASHPHQKICALVPCNQGTCICTTYRSTHDASPTVHQRS
jgi:hypothetical protein